jgi:hypothetical protein
VVVDPFNPKHLTGVSAEALFLIVESCADMTMRDAM